jgi:hypothetical protein
MSSARICVSLDTVVSPEPRAAHQGLHKIQCRHDGLQQAGTRLRSQNWNPALISSAFLLSRVKQVQVGVVPLVSRGLSALSLRDRVLVTLIAAEVVTGSDLRKS